MNIFKKTQKAFTMIEILIVSVMLGILFMFVVGNNFSSINKSTIDFLSIIGSDNTTNKHFVLSGNQIKTCNIELTGGVNNFSIAVKNNKCSTYNNFLWDFQDKTEFNKIYNMFLDNNGKPVTIDNNFIKIQSGYIENFSFGIWQ